MPEGILQPLKQDQICDLIAYLMSPGQVDLPTAAETTGAAAPATGSAP